MKSFITRKFSKSLILIVALVILIQFMQHETRACNVAVVTAEASATGRPFLWKNRDHAESYKQEVKYYPEVISGVGGSLRLMGETTYNSGVAVCTGGANESGFAIANTTCYESVTREAVNVNTELMEVALEECRTLADFEQLASEFTDRWSSGNISGIFAVIDAHNGAAIYEMWSDGYDDIMYRKFDAHTGSVTDENGSAFSDIRYTQTVGFNNRTNSNHTDGWIDIWTDTPRELRARQLMTEMLANDELSPRNFMRQVSKDVCGGDPADYCTTESKVMSSWDDEDDSYDNPNRDGEMYTRYCISRYQTTMGLVVEGAASPAEANLTTMWVSLGEPSLSVFVPFFPAAGEASLYAWHDEHQYSDDRNRYYWNGTWESYDNGDNSFLNLLFDCVESNPFGTAHPLYDTYNAIELYKNNGTGAFTDTQDRNDGEYYGWFTYKMDTTINYPRLMSLQGWTLPLEDNVFDRTEEFTSLLRANPLLISSEELAGFSDYCNEYVYRNYSHQSDAYEPWGRALPDNELAPEVISVYPEDGAADVLVSDVITARFSEAMDESWINEDTFTLWAGSTEVVGDVQYDAASMTATFYPVSPLQYESFYTVVLNDDIRDLSGDQLVANYSWGFTTAGSGGGTTDEDPPETSSVYPTGNSTDVAVNTLIMARFNEDMNEDTINEDTFELYRGTTQVPGTVTYDSSSHSAVFEPDSDLVSGAGFTAVLSTGMEDLAGNPLNAEYSWTFTTSNAQPDYTAPTVRSIYPADNTTGFSVSGVVTARFSEPMDQSSIDELTFGLFVGEVRVEGYVDYDPENYIATFYPDSDLEYDAAYTVTLTDDIRDAAGNQLAGNYSWDFTTASEPSGDAPRVQWVFPADASTDFPIWKNLAVRFSKPMNADSIHEGTFVLFRGSTRISGSVAYNAATHTATFDPDGNLATGTEYTVDLSTSITDEESNRITGEDSWSFSTEVGDPFGRTKKSDGGDGCSSIAEASTPSGGAGPVAPGLMSLAVTMLFPLSLMMLHRRIRRKN